MEVMIRRWCLATILAVLVTLVAACGGGGGTTTGGATSAPAEGGAAATTAPPASGAATSAPAEGGAAATTAPAAGGEGGAAACPAEAQGQQIAMWSPLTGPDGKFMTDLAAQFSQESGVTVNHLPQPDYMQKLNTAAAGQSLPDMSIVRAINIGELAARNVLRPMTPELLSQMGDDISGSFPEQVWNIGEYNGQHYAVPLDIHPLVLYYNKEMFQQAGLEEPGTEPMTKEEFETAASTLNKEGVAGYTVGTAFGAAAIFQTLVRQFGGQLVNDDGTEATYNSDAGVQALTYIRDLKQQYSPQISGEGDPEVKAFQQGQAAMVIHGPWHISDMERLGFVGFAPVPQIGSEYAVWGGSHQLAITTDDPAKQAAAACWIGWLSQNSAQWAPAGQVPARNEVREDTSTLESVAPAIAAIAAEADDVLMLPSTPGIEVAVWPEGFGRAVDAVLLGQQADPKAALDAAANRSNQIIQQNQQRYATGS